MNKTNKNTKLQIISWMKPKHVVSLFYNKNDGDLKTSEAAGGKNRASPTQETPHSCNKPSASQT
jgi:hypothetical protein